MQLKDKFERGEFAVLAEMEPPKGVDVTGMTENAARVKGKVDAFVVPEMSNAVMRMSSLGGAMVLQGRGLETVFQVCCRDRNRIAIQADLLAAYGCGITSVMAVHGEDTSFGDHHQARSVYDIDLLDLLRAIRGLEEGRDMAGIELAGAPEFLIGSRIDAAARDRSPELEADEIRKKVEAGAEFFISPPVFDLSVIEPFQERFQTDGVKIIPTVLLLKSVGMARYMARNVEAVYVPDEVVTRIQKAPDKVNECVALAADLVRRIKDAGYAGVLIATIGWEQKLPGILEYL
ncbi:5,10-methylenetetrahydrofolate reductase (EC [Olavius algarvensis associated proteobacterium Delta 3]|nr:5,10-methylenetetrahydrofolate reductase (EC [Olavius algarvensis associated proteobacterium Delta 3]